MLEKLILYMAMLLLMVANVFSATITYTTDYGVKNYILFIFLLALFVLWLIIYRASGVLEWNKKDLVKSLTTLVIKFVCWGWFIAIAYIFQSVLFISSGTTFLTDKLELLYSLVYITLILFGILSLFNALKLYNKVSGTTEFFKNFVWEIKTGGRK